MYKNIEDLKEYQRKWYLRNKERIIAKTKLSNKRYKKANREFVCKIKSNNPCSDCKKFYHFSAMDFDHTSDNKVNSIARLVGSNVSLKYIKKEIEKCELVCANCHRVRTYKRLKDRDIAELA